MSTLYKKSALFLQSKLFLTINRLLSETSFESHTLYFHPKINIKWYQPQMILNC
jgi:hypothetical protein